MAGRQFEELSNRHQVMQRSLRVLEEQAAAEQERFETTSKKLKASAKPARPPARPSSPGVPLQSDSDSASDEWWLHRPYPQKQTRHGSARRRCRAARNPDAAAAAAAACGTGGGGQRHLAAEPPHGAGAGEPAAQGAAGQGAAAAREREGPDPGVCVRARAAPFAERPEAAGGRLTGSRTRISTAGKGRPARSGAAGGSELAGGPARAGTGGADCRFRRRRAGPVAAFCRALSLTHSCQGRRL